MRHVIFILFSPNEQLGRGGGDALPDFFFVSFPYSTDHERDWPPYKVPEQAVFFGLAATFYAEYENNNAQKV